MIIELFLLKDGKTPKSVMMELTPETIAEEDSLRNATILHKNQIQVYWGDTLELRKVSGCIQAKNRTEHYIGFSGLKVNFALPKRQKPIFEDKVCQHCAKKFTPTNSKQRFCKKHRV